MSSEQQQPSELSVELSPTERASRHARRAAERWMRSLTIAPQRRDDILVAISELVTNAVTHARSAVLLRIKAHDHRLRVEVFDSAVQQPRIREHADATGGFGLRLVARLAAAWGWEPQPVGKLVWAEIDLIASDDT